MKTKDRITSLLPGLALTLVVTAAAQLGEKVEIALFGQRWIEGLVLAIVLGTAVRSLFSLSEKFDPGINFSAKQILEIAIVLLGASISIQALAGAGIYLVFGIVGTVCVSLIASYTIGRALGLHSRLALLVACGNSICGNSAIAATAPLIDADAEDVAASIAFTAVLGVAFVLILPFIKHELGMTVSQYGVFAGLTVYAVPQVLAATAPAGLVATQIGTLVKLVRVLMLGPVICVLGLGSNRKSGAALPIGKLLPWFIVGFLGMMALRSFGLIPDAVVTPMQSVSSVLTVISMAALGLTVDVRSVMGAGGRVVFAAKLSLIALSAVAFGLLTILGIS
jgi:uncharacterized integral membrane protein (TIGR00698 family)